VEHTGAELTSGLGLREDHKDVVPLEGRGSTRRSRS